MMRVLVPLLAAALLLEGCSVSLIGKASPPPPFLINLTPTGENLPKAGNSRTVQASDVVVVTTPVTPQAIALNRVPVTRNGNAVAYLTGGSWVEQPARLFQRLLAETIRARTGHIVLDIRQFPGDPGRMISGQLLHMEVEESTNQVIVVYDATIVASGKKVRTRRFEARAPVSVIDVQNVAVALNDAANAVAGEVATWAAE